VPLVLAATACDHLSQASAEPYDDPAANPDARTSSDADGEGQTVAVLADGDVVHDGANQAVEGPAGDGTRWTLVQATDAETSFLDFQRGVLIDVGGAFHRVADGRLLAHANAKPSADAKVPWDGPGDLEVEGEFPADAWTVQISHYDRSGASITLRKFKDDDDPKKSSWVAQRIKPPSVGYFSADGRSLEADDAFMLRKGSLGGYLVAGFDYDEGKVGFSRVSGGRGAPRAIDVPKSMIEEDDAYPVDFFEDGSGQIHVLAFSYQKDHTVILSSQRCKKSQARCEGTPHDLESVPQGNFGQVVSRDQRSFTAGLNDGWNESTWASHLIHFDEGNWTTEPAPAKGHVRNLLAANDGGLWAVVEATEPGQAEDDRERGKGEQQLWHRTASGSWSKVSLPEGLTPNTAGGLDIAIDQADQLWLAVNANGRHGVFTSDASGSEIA